MLFDTVCVVGVGLIGGSFGKAIRERGLARHVIGVVRREETARAALQNGAIDEATTDLIDAARRADLIFMAPPVGQMWNLCAQIAPFVRADAIITDGGSTKAEIVRDCAPLFSPNALSPNSLSPHENLSFENAQKSISSTAISAETNLSDATSQIPVSPDTNFAHEISQNLAFSHAISGNRNLSDTVSQNAISSGAQFIGGHPMAGSEQSGVEASRADLFENAAWILTPNAETSPDALQKLTNLIEKLGARVLLLDATAHDEMLAITSHLPHVTASALTNLFAKSRVENEILPQIVAGGWRDSTRIAAGNAEMWRDISLANAPALQISIDEMIGELQKVRALLDPQKSDELRDWFEHAAIERRKYIAK